MDFPFALIKVTSHKWREMAQIKAKALVKIGKPFQTASLMMGYGRLKAPRLLQTIVSFSLQKSFPLMISVQAEIHVIEFNQFILNKIYWGWWIQA